MLSRQTSDRLVARPVMKITQMSQKQQDSFSLALSFPPSLIEYQYLVSIEY